MTHKVSWYMRLIFEHFGNDTQLSGTERATTMISWPSTLYTAGNNSESRAVGRPDTTFLRPTASFSRFVQHRQRKETQGTQETNSYSFSFNDSSDASVARFPHFHFSLHSLTSLSSLSNQLKGPRAGGNHGDFPRSSKLKANILVAVLGTEGPDTVRIKSGPDAGKEVCLFKIVVGDEEGQVCKLTAWREVAERWGGVYPGETQTQRGDIVYLQGMFLQVPIDCRNHRKPRTLPQIFSPHATRVELPTRLTSL